ncbi:MAG TPA: magnesium/cobalt transporter CorA [Candidatus Dormibacteraeota bacterium]|nr:magnesium/cobalt transporter CorA [Candidatus Dormibacteraeota bacterium]
MNMVVNCAVYENGCRVRNIPVEDISEALKDPGVFVWVGLHEPDEPLLRQIQEEFGLHDLAVEDALRAHQRPKLEEYGDGLFVVLRTARLDENDEGHIALGETHIFLGPHYVVSVRHGASFSYAEVRTRCETTPHLLKKGPAFVLYALMDFVVDHYFPIVEQLEERLSGIEEEIFSGRPDRAAIEQIYDLKRDLLVAKRAVSPLVDICNRLTRFDVATIPEDTRPYFRDVYDHTIRINETIDTLRELVTSALESKLSLISVEQSDITKQLAAWAAIIAVPTMIAGIYGMNFEFIPELHWRYGYHGAIAVMFSVCGFLYWRFKKSGWL